MFEWNDKYSVGYEKIDDQHKELLSIGKELEDLIKYHGGEDIYDSIVESIDRIKEYTIFHFEFEENMLEEGNYKFLDAHKVEHEKFIDQLDGIDLSEIDENQEESIMDIMKFVSKWIFKHIMGTDMQYKGMLG